MALTAPVTEESARTTVTTVPDTEEMPAGTAHGAAPAGTRGVTATAASRHVPVRVPPGQRTRPAALTCPDVPPAVPARDTTKGTFDTKVPPIKHRQAPGPGQAGRYAPVFTWSANLRHAAGLNCNTGPERSVVSRTSTPRRASPTSTQFPPLPLKLDLRQRGSIASICRSPLPR